MTPSHLMDNTGSWNLSLVLILDDMEGCEVHMLEGILREIEEMGYPSVGIGCGLEDAGITDRYEAAAYGFEEATERILEIIRSYRNDGWIPCSTGEMPYGGSSVLIQLKDGSGGVTGDDGMEFDISFVRDSSNKEWASSCGTYLAEDVIAWRPISPYRPQQKSVGEDYKQRVMERFLKVE